MLTSTSISSDMVKLRHANAPAQRQLPGARHRGVGSMPYKDTEVARAYHREYRRLNKDRGYQARRAQSSAFVADLNARTICAHCGGHPVEWHNPEHVEQQRERFRISNMASKGDSLEAIHAELDRCTPLCRRCHMAEDGRLEAVRRSHGPVKAPGACGRCHRIYKPLRGGLCGSCYAGQPERLARRRALRANSECTCTTTDRGTDALGCPLHGED
jgi:hypothetical protein